MNDKPHRQPPAPCPAEPAPRTAPEADKPRRPYAPPIVESGEAFERVQLQSGTGFGDPIDCPPA